MANTPHRAVRVADPLWSAAQAVALARGESLSDVIREALRGYVERHQAALTRHRPQ